MIQSDRTNRTWSMPAAGAIVARSMPRDRSAHRRRRASEEDRLADPPIRAALVARLASSLREEEIIVHELGLLQGSSRVDVAVVNGCLHGYEIKSDVDTLARLSGQLEAYSRTLHYVTLVVTPKHLRAARAYVPRWWGIDIASAEVGGVHITPRRKARPNPKLDRFSLAQFLWRDEVIAILRELGVRGASLQGPRRAMWQKLAERLTVEELTTRVCTQLRARGDWRDDPLGAHAAAS